MTKTKIYVLLALLMTAACSPKEPVVLRSLNINQLETGKNGKPVLKADAIFYNPNTSGMNLKKVDIDIWVDGVKAARVDQHLGLVIKAKSEFTIPVEVQLNTGDSGLLDTILGFLGGKKHEIHFVGKLKVTVNGFPLRIPVDHKETLKFLSIKCLAPPCVLFSTESFVRDRPCGP